MPSMADQKDIVRVTKTTETTYANDAGPVHSSAPSAPTVTTHAAHAIGATMATLRGTVHPNGVDTVCWFEYSTDPLSSAASIRSTPQKSLGAHGNPLNVETDLSGLLPNTTYYFRLVAENPHGRAVGA